MTEESKARDRDAIVNALYLYARAIDTKDFSLLESIFTDDALIDYSVPGGTKLPIREMIPWLKEALSMFRLTQHCVTNPIVVVQGDRATSTAYLTATHEQVGLNGRETTFVDHGIYKDRWLRTAHGWRISRRRLERFFLRGDFQLPSECKRYPTAPRPVALPLEEG